MPVYAVIGKLGAGKTLSMVGRMRDYLRDGRPVATNIDLFPDALFRRKGPKAPIFRLPDKLTAADLMSLPPVHRTGDEKFNGALVLDEGGVFLNARSWNDKDRAGVTAWLRHARKQGWDVYLLIQGLGSLDKQIRADMVEYHVVCRRMDRIKVPFLGAVGRFLTLGLWSGNFPTLHVAQVRYGTDVHSLVVDRWVYTRRGLERAYNTNQVLLVLDEAVPDLPPILTPPVTPVREVPVYPGETEPRGLHCLLWYPPGPKQPGPVRPSHKPKREMVDLIMRLPPDRRLAFMERVGMLHEVPRPPKQPATRTGHGRAAAVPGV